MTADNTHNACTRNVLLFSGGLDGYIAYHYLKHINGRPPITIYVDLKHCYSQFERDAVERLLPQTIICDHFINMGAFESPDSYIPLRNAFLLMTAALICPPDKRSRNIYNLVSQLGEQDLVDRSKAFFDSMSHVFRVQFPGIPIMCSPVFSMMSKVDMVKWYLVNVEKEGSALIASHSCYNGFGTLPCGVCTACFRRWVAFSLNGIGEPYAIPFTKDNPIVKSYVAKIKKKQYSGQRLTEMREALKLIGVKI